MTSDTDQLALQNKFLKQSLTDIGKAFTAEREARINLEKVIEQYKEANKGACTMGEMRKDREILMKQENEELKEDQGKKMTLEQADAWRQVWKARYQKLKTKCQDLENEMILVKGITVTNSPEMREANKKIKELEKKVTELTNPVPQLRKDGL